MRVAKVHRAAVSDISYIFCTDDYLLEINQQYLKHDTLTDTITFDYGTAAALVGEIYISLDRVAENASMLKVDFQEELKRVMVHGLLHLLGLDDKTKAQKQAMRKKEDACLSLWSKRFT